MDQFTRNLYELTQERVLAKVISSRDIVRPKALLDYEFRDSIVGTDDAILFGCLEPNTSILLHLLRPEYHADGWFRLTHPTHWGFGAARVLYDMQLAILKELVERDSENSRPTMSWIMGKEERDILIYIDLEHVNVYAPWEERSAIGLLGQDEIHSQEGLLRQAAHHPVQATVQLQHISQFTESIQAFVLRVVRLDIIPVG